MGTDARGFPRGDLRASDAERDWPLSELSEACQSGRITADELDGRSTQALRVRTGKKLTAPRRPVGYLVSRLAIGAFQTLRPSQGPGGGCVGDDVEQVERSLHPGEELVWQETTRGERIGLVIRPPVLRSGERLWNVVKDFLNSAE